MGLAETHQTLVLNDLRDMSAEVAMWDTGEPMEFVQGNLLDLDPARLGTFVHQVMTAVANRPNKPAIAGPDPTMPTCGR